MLSQNDRNLKLPMMLTFKFYMPKKVSRFLCSTGALMNSKLYACLHTDQMNIPSSEEKSYFNICV